MSEKKPANYSKELTEKIVSAYTAEGVDTDADRKAVLMILSEETGKNVKSLRAKLVREGVYVKPAYVTKSGGASETKDRIVASIAELLNVTEAQLGGLENATKPALELIRAQFVEARIALATAFKPEASSDSE